MRSALKRRLREYAVYFLVWTVVGLFFFSQALTQKAVTREPTPWWHYLVSWLVGVYISALLTPVILWLGRRFPIEKQNWLSRTALHLLFSTCFALTQLGCEGAILSRLGVFPSIMKTFGITFIFLLVIGLHQSIATYWVVLLIQYAIRYYRSYREREEQALRLELHTVELKSQLMRSQLSALKMQLQPHFLFNTLNAIMVLVRQHRASEAEQMLARLSDLLRCVLDDVEAQEVPLRRELEYLQLYLSIEEVRFQDRLRVDISADPSILDAAVPHMILQPIVENAIRHGIGRSSMAGNIKISASRANGLLEIRVHDDGPGFHIESASHNRGIGIANTQARLNQLYSDAANLSVENGKNGGAVVTITLPFHVAQGNTETEVIELHGLHNFDR